MSFIVVTTAQLLTQLIERDTHKRWPDKSGETTVNNMDCLQLYIPKLAP